MFDIAGILVAVFFLMLFGLRWSRRNRQLSNDREFVDRQKNEMIDIITRHEAEKIKKQTNKQ